MFSSVNIDITFNYILTEFYKNRLTCLDLKESADRQSNI